MRRATAATEASDPRRRAALESASARIRKLDEPRVRPTDMRKRIPSPKRDGDGGAGCPAGRPVRLHRYECHGPKGEVGDFYADSRSDDPREDARVRATKRFGCTTDIVTVRYVGTRQVWRDRT